MNVYNYKGIRKLQEDLASGITTPTALVEHALSEIRRTSKLNAFLETFDTSAKALAEQVEKKIKDKKQGRLAGVIVGLKDNICYKDHKVSASSKILEGFESLYSATVVERLLAEDAIIIGRLNCDEFAMGSSNENSAFGNVLNPRRETCVPGGSSGGAAAAVAAGLCHISLGSDTGGSIRQPASFTGTVGFKPTYGRVSRYGLIAYASSFDQIGPISLNVEDAAIIMEVISGHDKHDSTSSSKPVEKYSEAPGKKQHYRVAYLRECLEADGIDPE